MTLSRRELLRNSALTGAFIASGAAFSGFASGVAGAGTNTSGYGPLVPDPAGILDLPRGFRYTILQKGGDGNLADATRYTGTDIPVAGDADGAASFAIGGGRTAVVTNHELRSGGSDELEGVPTDAEFTGPRRVPTYNPAESGGTSTIVLDPRNRVVEIYPSIAGTRNNCAGGPAPWGSWFTCEENTDFFAGHRHGYVFEVDASGERTVAEPIREMGRYYHEAVAFDPETSDAYLTEDDDDGLVYRFVPNDTSMTYGSMANGGELSAMKASRDGRHVHRLGECTTPGTTLSVEWVPIAPEVADPDIDDMPRDFVNQSFADDEITRSRKLEGCWWGDADGRFYFTCSTERDRNRPQVLIDAGVSIEHDGQVWAYDPSSSELQLIAHITVDDPTFDGPDNITVAPWGTVFLCEDGGGDQYVVQVDPATGALAPFAFNRTGDNEFAGANFSPDGRTMFVNLQNPSTTFAITGPWGAVR